MALLVAHRGFRSSEGENRMIDFINALQVCKAVEFDIRMTKDQKIIIFHDHNFKRIGNLKKTVRSLTYEEIKNIAFFKIHQDSLPPLLVDDFAKNIAKKYEMINIEIKPDHYNKEEFILLENALKQVKKQTKAEIIVSSFGSNALKFIAELNSKLFKKAYLIEKLKDINQDLLKKFDYLNPSIKILKNKKNIAIIKKINLPMNIWTFKDNEDVIIINNLYPKKLIHSYISDNRNLKIN